MKVLLIGGAPSTGKSNAVCMCARYLINRGFVLLDCQDYNGQKIKLPTIVTGSSKPTDFLARLDGTDKNNKKVSVIIASASDTIPIIDSSFSYFQKKACDILISSVRDINYERKYLFSKFHFQTDDKSLMEFPLAKMSRKNQNWCTAKNWCDSTVRIC